MNKRTAKHKRYLVEIEVNEKTLRNEREELDADLEIQEAIEQEFDWLHQSGIYVTKIKAIKEKHQR